MALLWLRDDDLPRPRNRRRRRLIRKSRGGRTQPESSGAGGHVTPAAPGTGRGPTDPQTGRPSPP